MVGREMTNYYTRTYRKPGKVVMSVKHLSSNYVKDVSFDLREGEILGFSGLVGAGRTEVIKAILGFDEMTAGTVELYGNEIHIKTPSQAYAQKIGFYTRKAVEKRVCLHYSPIGST